MKRLSVFFSSRKSWTLPYIIFSAIFVVIPLLLIVVYAFTDDSGHLTLENFAKFFQHHEAINTFVYSIGIAIITTIVCILLGYPAAWILSNAKLNRSKTMVVLFILPMWVNILVRTLATVALFDFFSVPLGEGALIFGMVYNFIPFMIYPIYNTLQKMDHSYIEAAQDLGANPVQVFFKAVLPLSMPGVMSGIMMVFMPTISTFAIAELLTMNNIKLFGTTIQENINNSMWNYGAALSLIMLLLIAATSLFSTDDKDNTNEGGGLCKEDFRSDLFVDSAFAALFAYRDYNDLLFYRGKSAGQLDRILHKTVFVTVHYRHSPFADECADQYRDHCFDCSYGFHPAGEYHCYRHLQPEGTFAEGHQLCEQHSYPEWGYYYRYFTVSVVCVAGDIAGIYDRCTGTHHFLYSLCGTQRVAPSQADES